MSYNQNQIKIPPKRFIFSSFILLLLPCLSSMKVQESKVFDRLDNQSSLPKFESIQVSGVAKVYFTQEETKEITMVVSGDPYPQVVRKVNNGVLEIYTKGEARNEVVEVFVSNPTLKSVVVADRAEFHSTNDIKSETLEITVDDVGSADLTIDVEKLSIHMDGGDLKISGKTNEQHITRSKDSDRGSLESNGLVVIN